MNYGRATATTFTIVLLVSCKSAGNRSAIKEAQLVDPVQADGNNSDEKPTVDCNIGERVSVKFGSYDVGDQHVTFTDKVVTWAGFNGGTSAPVGGKFVEKDGLVSIGGGKPFTFKILCRGLALQLDDEGKTVFARNAAVIPQAEANKEHVDFNGRQFDTPAPTANAEGGETGAPTNYAYIDSSGGSTANSINSACKQSLPSNMNYLQYSGPLVDGYGRILYACWGQSGGTAYGSPSYGGGSSYGSPNGGGAAPIPSSGIVYGSPSYGGGGDNNHPVYGSPSYGGGDINHPVYGSPSYGGGGGTVYGSPSYGSCTSQEMIIAALCVQQNNAVAGCEGYRTKCGI